MATRKINYNSQTTKKYVFLWD